MLPIHTREGQAVMDAEHRGRSEGSRPVSRSDRAKGLKIGLVALLLMAKTNPVRAQAWGTPAGEGAASFIYQTLDNTGHRVTNGQKLPVATSSDRSLYFEAEYAFTNRLSLSAGVPYVFAKYTDSDPPPSPIPYLPTDQCHCWQSGWQDFGVTARYNLTNGAFGLTPLVSLGEPSHNYNFRGESALGDHLREVRIGVESSRRLTAISRDLTIQGSYSYAIVEKVLGISLNRSNVKGQVSYRLKRRFSVLGQFYWQRTHGGIRLGSPPPADLVFPGEVTTPELLYQHDRLLRDNYWRAGGGLNYSLRQLNLFATYTLFLAGTDTHSGRALSLGFSVPFLLGRTRR